jgi:hypothetical protein
VETTVDDIERKRRAFMRTRQLLGTAIVVLAVAGASARGQERLSEHTLALAADAKPAPATIADVAWLAGRWTGDGLGGRSEETWGAPVGGSMVGMFRLSRDGKPVFYEIMTFVEREGSVLLRLKHFNPDLTGWEEKDQTVDFPLVSKGEGVLHFRGLTFRREDAGRLTIYLSLKQKDGTRREEVFRLTRDAS